MRLLLPIVLTTLFAANSAFAATCAEQSTEKKLAGAAKASFMKKCEEDAKPAAASCDSKAAEKKLAGAAKTSFMKKCEEDAKGGPKGDAKAHAHPSCADQAAEKKLAGAAKASFTKVLQPENLGLLAIVVLWMGFHVAFMLQLRRWLRAPIFFLGVGSFANIGGAASAPVVAGAFHPALAPVGVLLAILGYVLGTVCGLVAMVLLKLVAMTFYLSP